MKIKRKVVHTVQEAPVGKSLLLQFEEGLKKTDDKHHVTYVREWFEKVFGEYPDPEVHIELVKTRIQYELLVRGCKVLGVEPSPNVKQNWVASQAYNIEGMTPSMQNMMLCMTKQKGESSMGTTETNLVKPVAPVATKPVAPATPKKPASAPVKDAKPTSIAGKPAPKAVKETVTQTYIRLFQTNASAKLTDAALAGAMCKAHPDKKKYDVSDIVAIRSMYNRGKLVGQIGAPKAPAFVVEVKK